MRALRHLLAITAILVFPSCRYEDSSWKPIAGAAFPYWKAACITAGMAESDVRTVLGPPPQQALGSAGTSVWVYSQTRQRLSTVRLIWLIPIPTKHTDCVSIRVAFRKGRVTRVDTENVDSSCERPENVGLVP